MRTIRSSEIDAASMRPRAATGQRGQRRGHDHGRGRVRRLAAILATLASLVAPAVAHEMQASIADIDLAGGRVSIELRTNGEALLAGIGAEHDDTADSPRAAEYDALRALSPAELEGRLEAFAPTFARHLMVIQDNGAAAALEVEAVEVSDQPDLELVRDTRMVLAAELFPGTRNVAVRLDPLYGDLILRGTGENSDYGEFLQAGAESGPIAVPDGSMWDAVRGLFGR